MDSIFTEIKELVLGAYEMDDERLAKEIEKINKKIPSDVFPGSYVLNKLLNKRVTSYCKLNNIPIEQYDGPLPLRIFKTKTEE